MFDHGPAWLSELNEAQTEAATYGDGPLLVIAGAGSGKTKTLACRVAWLIEQGVPPDRILLLTFTRRSARELLARATRLTAAAGVSGVWGGTFHSVGNRLLRRYGRALGLADAFSVLDQSDSADVMNLVREELGLSRGRRRFPKKETLATIYSRTVNAGSPLGDLLQKDFPWCAEEVEGIRSIFEAYTVRKREQSLVDYDDLLLYWHALVDAPRVGDAVGALFDHVLVDEYQDTNALQARILQGLRRRHPSITVVGDDAQAIYSFRAATVDNILDFPKHFPGAHVVTLERNYRSTQPILDVSNAVIAQARRSYAKSLWTDATDSNRPLLTTCTDETEQSNLVCDRVLEQRERGTALNHQAVLFRAGHHSAVLEVELGRRNIPFVKFGGLKFMEAAHVKDVLSLLRILENPYDELAWFRVLQLMNGIGAATARRVIAELGVRRVGGPRDGLSPLRSLLEKAPAVPAHSAEEMEGLRATVADCLEAAPASQVERARRFFEPIFVRVYDAPAARLRDVEQLEQIASGYSSRARFLADLTLDPPSSSQDLAGPPLLDEDYLVLSTIHSAKGCEWDAVHVIHAADGMIPSDMALGDEAGLDEELRLFYVALTRAKRSLYVYFPMRYYYRPSGLGDRHGYGQLTRFITDDVKALFDQACTTLDAGDDSPRAGALGRVTVDDYLATLWS
jgi:DNA helicase II / ATP-dependent DNA helicase PcrA